MEATNVITKRLYDNFKIYHPDDTFMCFCSKKKATWYTSRNLAVWKSENEIKLTFEPNGYGDPTEILSSSRENICVISGRTDNLTKHHIVPTQYRKHFHRVFKDNNSCDLALLARDEHDTYEIHANKLKEMLFIDNVNEDVMGLTKDWNEAKSIYSCIDKWYHILPDSRKEVVLNRMYQLIDKWGFKETDLKLKEYSLIKDWNSVIVENVGPVNMIVLWKMHFIKYGQPKFMPKWWTPDTIKIINDDKLSKEKTKMIKVNIDNKLKSLIEKYDLNP